MKSVPSAFRMPTVDLGLVAFAAVLTASLVLNVRLELSATAQPAVFGQTGFLVGTRLPDVLVAAPGEPDHPLTFARNTLLYIFSPRCEWSKADYANLQAIAQASNKDYDVVGLYARPNDADDEVSNYLQTHPFPGTVVALDLDKAKLPDDLRRRFGSTPQLLVVAERGKIRMAWSGALFGRRQAEVEQHFRLRLPGIRMVGGVAVLASDRATR